METVKIKLSWGDGQVGVLPVFESKEKALEYADGKYDIFTFSVEDNDCEKM